MSIFRRHYHDQLQAGISQDMFPMTVAHAINTSAVLQADDP